MKTIAELDREINECLRFGAYRYVTKHEYVSRRIVFLNMCKRYLESSNEQSIRDQLAGVEKEIALHEKRIAEITERIESLVTKNAMASDYGKRVGLPRLREYQKTLKYIIDDTVLSPQ